MGKRQSRPWIVSDELWSLIGLLLPGPGPKLVEGRPRVPDRQALCGILFVLHTGIQWEYLPQELGFGSGMTCWRRLAAWNEAGVWLAGVVGRPRRRPEMLFADRGYDYDKYRRLLRQRGIRPAIAERGQRHGTGLGTFRCVVERTISWLHGFRRLRIRWQRRDDIHAAFLGLAVCLITHHHDQRLC
ncbi:transposase [Streptomyces sp. NPDC058914]|uniref:transposase n=1 Tax=Streptomyces sp. NPDC058914 TaxID=3346671 RepID=UPI0036BF7827